MTIRYFSRYGDTSFFNCLTSYHSLSTIYVSLQWTFFLSDDTSDLQFHHTFVLASWVPSTYLPSMDTLQFHYYLIHESLRYTYDPCF